MSEVNSGSASRIKVVNLASEIAGGYCSRLLADAGAEIVRIEDPQGDPLRAWSATGSTVASDDNGALFQFLAAGSISVVADDPEELLPTLRNADVFIWSPHSTIARTLTPERLRELNPMAVVTAISDFGLTGPWSDRAATELTLQAMSGGPGQRGVTERPPLAAGARLGEWMAGMFAAVHTMAAVYGGGADLVDVSVLESLILTTTVHPVSWYTIAGYPMRPIRSRNLPDIHPTRDGYIGFMVVTGQQWLDFCSLVDRSEWMDDPDLGIMANRARRRDELVSAIDTWTSERTSAEILEIADLLRVPAAVVGTGSTIPSMDHLVARGAFEHNDSGDFLQPVIAWRLHGVNQPDRGAAPRLGEHDLPKWSAGALGAKRTKPFEGLRVADFTANWAGPIVGHTLALLGADVIHVEGGKRPDAIRNNTCKPMTHPDWPEFSGLFAGTNTGKRSASVDMSTESGREIARQLIANCDVVLENYSPRVMESWGLSWEDVRAINPRAVMVRMPAYGLDGPWRDRGGYAQTLEMISGMAATTGWPDSTPEIPNGPCDPIAGSHTTVGLIAALREVAAGGAGILVESPMISAALSVAAESVIEVSAYGSEMARLGNRSPRHIPQGIYPTADEDRAGVGDRRWTAISVTHDASWMALCELIGRVDWSGWSPAERSEHHDDIDEEIRSWTAVTPTADVLNALAEGGIAHGEVMLGHLVPELEQLRHRAFFEQVAHAKTGVNTHATLSARWASITGPILTKAAPLLGEDDQDVWVNEVGISRDRYQQLRDEGVIGRGQMAAKAW